MRLDNVTIDMIRQGFNQDMFTKKWFVDPVNGSDGNEGKSITNAKKTFAAGYAKCTENKNEVLYIVGGASALASTAILALSKDYTHIIGLTAPLASGGRVRFTNTITTATTGEFTSDTVGCIYQNLHFQWGDSATATSVIGFKLSGERNHFKNVEFEGPIDATVAGGTANRPLQITSCQDNVFEKCTFGQRTIANTATDALVCQIGFTGSNVSNNRFIDCDIISYNVSTAVCMVHFAHEAMPDSGYTLFKNCRFISLSASNNMADVFEFATNAHGKVILDSCALIGTGMTVWTTNYAANVFIVGPLASATGGLAI